MLLIGIHGKRNTGKDTVAKMISEQLNTSVQLIAFADRLKNMCAVTFDAPLLAFHDQDLKETYETPYGTPRELMISLSDMIKTKYGLGFFRDLVSKRIDTIRDGLMGSIIVTDVRYEIEADMLREKGGTIIHLKRDMDLPGIYHSSERGIYFNAGDYAIHNDSTLEDLKRQVVVTLLQITAGEK